MSKSRVFSVFLGLATLWAFGALARAADQDVRAHGAKGDGTTLDAAAFTAAIDAASASGGGTVRVPPGSYLIAHVELKSNVTLHLDKGATLLGSADRNDYGGKSSVILLAVEAEHICVEGEGEINGQCTGNFGKRWGAPEAPKWRTNIIRIDQCHDVVIRGVTLRNSDSWTLHLFRCQHVHIDGISIIDNYKRLNTDGIDPNCCKDVKISHCHIVTGDDSIVIKSTEPYPCEDIDVSDCLLESATAGIKIGTESHGDFRHIRFRNCKIVNSPVGIGFFVKDGAVVQDVTAEKIDMQLCPPTVHAVVPLYIDIEKRHADSKIGVVRDVAFSDIHITGGSGLLMQGMPESLLENVTLRNIAFEVKEPEDYATRKKPVGGTRTTKDARDTLYARAATYAAMANMKNLTIEGLSVNVSDTDFKKFPRTALSLFNVDGAAITGVTRSPAAGEPGIIEQTDCKQVRIVATGK